MTFYEKPVKQIIDNLQFVIDDSTSEKNIYIKFFPNKLDDKYKIVSEFIIWNLFPVDIKKLYNGSYWLYLDTYNSVEILDECDYLDEKRVHKIILFFKNMKSVDNYNIFNNKVIIKL